ncbi:GNAT family N-acetyltransferase, partial [Amycolatopsis sp. NPDC059657]|uniref:GNAT family N-acetyltransferase n=1 Tax=Amycolatopsis sp. NPDC059657 TaxID=3346899 RepID=UPI0036701F45
AGGSNRRNAHDPFTAYGSIGTMVEFRDATPADAHGIADLLVRSWRAAYQGLIPDEVLAGLSVADRERFWSDVITTRPPHTDQVVATSAGAIVGFAATGPPLVPADREDPTLGDLYALYLDPDVWRRGIGTQLLAVALDRLRSRGFTHAGLWVLDTNESALRFYERNGWTDTGRTQVDRGRGAAELHERRLHRDLGGRTAIA